MLREHLTSAGAVLANDEIPLHFGDQHAEYNAAHQGVIVLVRSHEGRLELTGHDRLAVVHRISTNDVASLPVGAGAPTLFLNAHARILDRVTLYHRAERVLVITEPGRGAAVQSIVQRNVFFNDSLTVENATARTHQFDLHGVAADALVSRLVAGSDSLPVHGHVEAEIAGVTVLVARSKPLVGGHWTLVMAEAAAFRVWTALIAAGATPAGSLTYNMLRIEAGRPGVGRELSTDFIPLEVGLWDEVSFHKGCYTGQEIIARMESRQRVANGMLRVRLAAHCDAPSDLLRDGRVVGRLTSSVTMPNGDVVGIAVVKMAHTNAEHFVTPDGTAISPLGWAGTPPPVGVQEESV